MIFASDLDKTLIYATKFIGPEIDTADVEVLEVLDGKNLTHLTTNALNTLKEINDKMTFIPSTTRTIEQYKRIKFFEDLHPKYVVACSGAHILKDGEFDKFWASKVIGDINKTAAKLDDVRNKVEEICGTEWISQRRKGDDIFFYYNVDRKVFPMDNYNEFALWCSNEGWTSYLQDRKLYIVPTIVDKVHALNYLTEQIGSSIDVAAGDSLMDLQMLRMAGHSITPRHGEIFEYSLHEGIKVTESNGLSAGIEILNSVSDMAFSRV